MILQEACVDKESVANSLLQVKHLKATKSNNYLRTAAFTYSVVLLVVERRFSIWKINYRLKTRSQRKCVLKKNLTGFEKNTATNTPQSEDPS